MPRLFPGPSILGEPRVPSDRSETSSLIGELAEPSQEEEEHRRHNLEIEKLLGGGNDDRNTGSILTIR